MECKIKVGDKVKIINDKHPTNMLHDSHKLGDILTVIKIMRSDLVRVKVGYNSGWNYLVDKVVIKVDDMSDLPLFKGVVND